MITLFSAHLQPLAVAGVAPALHAIMIIAFGAHLQQQKIAENFAAATAESTLAEKNLFF